MSDHTPGPWSVGRAGYSNVVRFNGDDISGVAECGAHNAHLIAAAPELYEALKRSLDWLSSYQGAAASSVWVQARAAIAKAEGREP